MGDLQKKRTYVERTEIRSIRIELGVVMLRERLAHFLEIRCHLVPRLSSLLPFSPVVTCTPFSFNAVVVRWFVVVIV